MTTAARYKELMATDPQFRAHKLAYLRAHARKKRAERKALLDQIKLASGCIDCGFDRHSEALQLDHVRGVRNPRWKSRYGFATNLGSAPWADFVAEIEKCDIVCANCHAIRTAERRRP